MSLKLIIAIVGVLVLGSIGYFIFANTINKSPKTSLPPKEIVGDDFDFGDAPDGKNGLQFPSLLSSNGARSKKTDNVWLGQKVTRERDSKQVDLDEADDGVKLHTTVCKQSIAYFFVRIKNPGEMTGTAFLNLYADWNKDGKWSGSDGCGAEWAVQNMPIDLSKQTEETAVYQASFTAGKNVEDLWYRGTVTLDQKMDETATGQFQSGEIEDYYIPTEMQKEYWLYCDPNPLVLNHGEGKTVTIKADPFSQKIKSVALSTLVKPDNDIRKITQAGNSFTYKSKKVDGPKRDEPDFIPYSAEFTDGEGWWDWCPVSVRHDVPKTPIRRGMPVPSPIPHVETESGGQTKTESSQPQQPENHPIQEENPGVVKF